MLLALLDQCKNFEKARLICMENRLLKLASIGDQQAFTELFLLYKHQLYGFALRLTQSPELAQDITQDVFLKLWKDRSNLEQIENFGGYIFKLAQNQAINAFKRMANETLILSKIKKATDIYEVGTERALEYKDAQNLINDVVTKLPPQQKLIYKLSREDGLKHIEIASQLKISPSTVKNHLTLALRAIREYLHSNLHITDLYLIFILTYLFKK